MLIPGVAGDETAGAANSRFRCRQTVVIHGFRDSHCSYSHCRHLRSAVIAGRRCSLRRGTAPTSRLHWKGYRKGQGSLSHHNDTSKILLASKHYHRIIGAVWELIMIIGAVLGVLFAKSNQFRLLLKVSLSLSPKVQRERGLT